MKTKLILLAFLSIFSIQFLKADISCTNEVSGAWFGFITQTPSGLSDRYFFQLYIEEADGELMGQSYIAMENNDTYGIMNFKCEIQDGALHIVELEIVEEQLMKYAYWCMKSYLLFLKDENGTQVLEGDWQSEFCGDSNGSIHLERRLS